jgi:sterol 14-demethylase
MLSAAVQQLTRPQRRPSAPPLLSGGLPLVGHMGEWVRNPFALLMRARREGGEVSEFNLLGQSMVLLTGPEANEAFFRAPDDQLCRREAYKLMTPIFGEGVVFDAPGDRLNQQLGMVMRFLRDHKMRGYPPIIEDETKKALAGWGPSGEIDLLEVMKDLTLYGSSRCLIGDEFRGGMDEEFRVLYEALEKGVNPIAYFQPHLPLPSFKRRDQARVRLVERVEKILSRRGAGGPSDGLQALREATYVDGEHLSAHEITGILIAIMMAGHHTSAGTGTWVIVELLRNPHLMPRLRAELDAVWPDGTELTYERLRQMKFLGDVLKEVLRLHPPLIFLLRKVLREFRYNSYVVPAGQMLCAAPVVSHRLDGVFRDPERFDPDRFDRGEADNPFAWIPFGGGKNKCTGNAFGLLQLKAIVAVLLKERDFELVSPPGSYRDNYNAATVMPKGPVRIRHRQRLRRPAVKVSAAPVRAAHRITLDPAKPVSIKLDLGLCQGHSVCVSEAPDVFKISARGDVEVLVAQPSAARYEALIRAAEHCPNQVITLEQP